MLAAETMPRSITQMRSALPKRFSIVVTICWTVVTSALLPAKVWQLMQLNACRPTICRAAALYFVIASVSSTFGAHPRSFIVFAIPGTRFCTSW